MNSHRHYTNEKGEPRDRILWHCLYHVVNHGTQHRSEAAALLTDYGFIPRQFGFHRLFDRNSKIMNGQTRSNIKPGMTVLIVLKQDQPTGKLTKGIVKDIPHPLADTSARHQSPLDERPGWDASKRSSKKKLEDNSTNITIISYLFTYRKGDRQRIKDIMRNHVIHEPPLRISR